MESAMPESISRRTFAIGAVTAVAAAASKKVGAQTNESLVTDNDVARIEQQMAKPLSGEAKTILRNTLKANRDGYAARLKTKLPENSEPCFIYVPNAVEKKR